MEAMKYTLSKLTIKRTHVRCFATACLVVLAIVAGAHDSPAASQRPQQRRPEPRKTSPPSDPAAQALSPQEALDRARNASTQQERINLLEKFVAANRRSSLE